MHSNHSGQPSDRTTRLDWSLTLLAALASGLFRLIPFGVRPPNCTPIGSLGVFAGARLPAWLALLLPLTVMAGTDYLLFATLGLPPFNTWVYVSVLGYVLLGHLFARKPTLGRIAAASVLGSAQFFLITNFGVWLGGDTLPVLYPKTAAGLMECYVAALPFLGYTVLGDLGFTCLLFGLRDWLGGREAIAARHAQA